MSAKDRQGYSLAKALRSLIDPSAPAGLEREVSNAMAQRLGKHTGGLLVPTDMRMRAGAVPPSGVRFAAPDAQHHEVPALGGNLVMPECMGFLDLLKNTAVTLQLGASLVTGLQGNPTWVRQDTTSQFFWLDEAPAEDVEGSNLAFSVVGSSPKTAKAMLTYTRQQVLQSVEAFEPLLQKDLLQNDALVVDTAALNGTGSDYQPLGLLNTPGILAHGLGANGNRPTYADITRLKTLIKKANALGLGEGGYLTTPEIQDLLENTPRLGNTMALPVWDGDQMAGYKALGANQCPAGLSKGASAGVCHALIFGIWAELFILEWGALEIVVDPYTKAGSDIVRVITSHLVDVFVRRPQAFAAIKDALAS
jgi:HK97 family phage major capsid protein